MDWYWRDWTGTRDLSVLQKYDIIFAQCLAVPTWKYDRCTFFRAEGFSLHTDCQRNSTNTFQCKIQRTALRQNCVCGKERWNRQIWRNFLRSWFSLTETIGIGLNALWRKTGLNTLWRKTLIICQRRSCDTAYSGLQAHWDGGNEWILWSVSTEHVCKVM